VVNGIAEIECFDPDHLRAFSTRRQEILEAAGEGSSARARQIATLETRSAKDRDLSTESLRGIWREKAEEIGLTPESIRATLGKERQAPEGRVAIAEVAAEITAHASHFDRRDVIQAVANCLPAGASGDEVVELADIYLRTPDVIEIAVTANGPRFTTREIWELEQKALGTVANMAATPDRAVVPEIVVSRVLAARPSMKPDQRAMVERLLGGGEGVVVVIGEAGTGKTYALVAAAHGWASRETPSGLRVAAPTWRAANVLRAEGLPATSVAKLLAEFDRTAAKGEAPLASGSVLVVDEAGMVDSRTLARLIDRAQEAEAKLVLIGDPAQLGEIEAGGLFAAIAARTEPIVLDEVIRHRHELERDAAKLIREGAGSEAISVYEGAQRVTVSADPEARREAMVSDWWQSFERGEDALMIAKTNREVAALNARAREQMEASGGLGEQEIEVGGERFAVGDRAMTRLNDQRQEIFNRQRWEVAEVDGASGRMWLDGIDTRMRVCVDAVYLGRLRERDGGPAIEHAYAANTYQAQGVTMDKAFVAVDPSMDRQEIYVALSRTREDTSLYATPELQFERLEYAPRAADVRQGLDHIAEAAERDGSQIAAVDAALRAEFEQLSAYELASRVRELRSEAGAEQRNEALHHEAEKEIVRQGELIGSLSPSAHPSNEESALARIEEARADLDRWPEIEHQARAEAAVAEHVLAERARAAATAARISPPDYITAELGERPSDPAKARQWDTAVRGIEGFRTRNGVVDRDSALGPHSKDLSHQAEHTQTQRQIESAQRRLGRAHERAAKHGIEL
jgi:hypothetical protein